MLEITYIFTVLLGSLFAYKTLVNDPERDKIWGSGNKDAELIQKEREIELLRTQLDHYKSHHPIADRFSSREGSMVEA